LQALQIKVNPPEMMGSMGHGAEDIDPEELQGTGDVGFHFCFVYFLFWFSYRQSKRPPNANSCLEMSVVPPNTPPGKESHQIVTSLSRGYCEQSKPLQSTLSSQTPETRKPMVSSHDTSIAH
jgi:hypothetical protein